MRQEWSRLWPRLEPILDAVLELPEEGREARLRELCAGDETLLEAARELLDADRDSGSFLGSPPDFGIDPDETLSEAAGPDRELRRVGPFRIVRELGRGGMGTVLLGERDDGNFEQSVAIKVLHPGLAVGGARETLVRERRILAGLEHPRIARMFDGGVTETGEPYFVMENVEGKPLDAYCDARALGVGERLRLFLEVCRAVEYAHGRFVVHCDIKPRNILVTEAGEVKLLDFGIAQRLEEERQNRADGVRFFTPAWAAPEQASGGAITAATDVYQLGRILRELVPTEEVGPELRAIVERAVRVEPSERYPTAEALRRDVEALLDDRPVAAFGSSLPYRARKYLRRHRLAATAAAAAAIALAGGFLAVARERDRATLAERRAVAVNDFVLHELLRAPMPEVALGREPTVAEVLANASRSVGHAFQGEPEVEAEVRLTLAETYGSLGRSRDAREQAEATRLLLAGAGTAPVLRDRAERLLAGVAIDEGRLDEARATLERLLARERRALGPSHPETLETAAELGRSLRIAGEFSRAETVLRDAASLVRRDRPGAWRALVTIESLLAETLLVQSRGVEAEPIARSVLATVDRNLGPEHPERIRALLLQGSALTALYRYPEAAASTELALGLSRRIYGNAHPATADALTFHALAQERLSHFDAALAAVQESIAIREKALGPDHPRSILARYQLGVLTANADRRAEAVAIFRDVVARRAAILGEGHPDTLRAMKSLYLALDALERREETAAVTSRMTRAYEAATAGPDAEPGRLVPFADHLMTLLPKELRDPRRALGVAERAVATAGRQRFAALRTLADAQEACGFRELALAMMQEAIALPDGLRSWSTTEEVVRLLREGGRGREVETFLRAHRDRQLAPESPDLRMVAKTERLLALELQRGGRLAEAERLFAEAESRFARVLPGDNWELGRIRSERGGCLAEIGSGADAEPLLVEGLAILEKDRMARDATAQARDRLARFRGGTGGTSR